MNYMEQVARMLGVEIGEEFDIESDSHKPLIGCMLTEKGLHYSEDGQSVYFDFRLKSLLVGDSVVIKRPWRPKLGETYWFVTPAGLTHTTFPVYEDCTFDQMSFRVGNCYRTRDEITSEIIDGWVEWYKGGKPPERCGHSRLLQPESIMRGELE